MSGDLIIGPLWYYARPSQTAATKGRKSSDLALCGRRIEGCLTADKGSTFYERRGLRRGVMASCYMRAPSGHGTERGACECKPLRGTELNGVHVDAIAFGDTNNGWSAVQSEPQAAVQQTRPGPGNGLGRLDELAKWLRYFLRPQYPRLLCIRLRSRVASVADWPWKWPWAVERGWRCGCGIFSGPEIPAC